MENTGKNISFFRFEDLRVYDKAIEYGKWVTLSLPEYDSTSKTKLIKEYLKSVYAISLNIAEGSTRTKLQFEYCLKKSKSAIRECVVYTTLMKEIEIIDNQQYETSKTYLTELTKMIGALIISLQKGHVNKTKSNAITDTDTTSDFDPDFGFEI